MSEFEPEPEPPRSHPHLASVLTLTVGSLLGLGAGAWIYRVMAHGLDAGSASQITVDYAVIGAVYVIAMTWIYSRLEHRRAVASSIGFAIPVAAICIANIIVETGDDSGSDGLVVKAAAIVAVAAPASVLALLRRR